MDKTYLRLASELSIDSIVDGPGLRMVIWTQGCLHKCPGCHNMQTHDMRAGFLVDIQELEKQMREAKLQTGLTLSGGEPFEQAHELVELLKSIKDIKLSIWAYSGYTYEDILRDPIKKELLNYLDVLVDGKFRIKEMDHRIVFKGSMNQRIIDVKESLKNHTVVLSKYDDRNQIN